MSKLLSAVIAASIIGLSVSAIAADDMKHGKGMNMDMKAMDADSDGTVSKDEYMKYQESQYDKMKKNKDGTVDMKDMGMMHGGMMKGDRMHDDKMMHNDKMMHDDKMMDHK